jgi:perosamine synthetase
MASELSEALLSVLHHVAGPPAAAGPVALHEPRFAGREWDYVKRCLDTGWVSSAGAYVTAFEQALAQASGAQHAIAVANGTAALHVALMLSGVEPGDEVLVPALTFVATANAVSYCGAIPHFVDSDDVSLGVDPDRLAAYLRRITRREGGSIINKTTGRRIAALVPMHAFGHPVRLDELLSVAQEFGLAVVEDATESLGSTYKGKPTGALAQIGTFSFNGNKIITTGGGGAVVTNDAELARRARHITTTAKQPHRWEFNHDEVGYNYRLPNINAALGLAQLEQLPGFVTAKRAVALAYKQALDGVPGLTFFAEQPHTQSNYWLNTVLLDAPDRALRDALLAATNDAGYQTRPIWTCMHRLPMYASCPRDALPVAEALEDRIINLPSSVKLGLAGAAQERP